jgi:hypothetical protein
MTSHTVCSCTVPVTYHEPVTQGNPTALVRDFVFDSTINNFTVLEVSGNVRDI